MCCFNTVSGRKDPTFSFGQSVYVLLIGYADLSKEEGAGKPPKSLVFSDRIGSSSTGD